jgi:hypothetical protein
MPQASSADVTGQRRRVWQIPARECEDACGGQIYDIVLRTAKWTWESREADEIVSNHKNEADRFEQVWSRACPKDSPLVKGDVEMRECSSCWFSESRPR